MEEFFLVRKGQLRISVGDEVYTCAADDFVYVPAAVRHSIEALTSSEILTIGYAISLGGKKVKPSKHIMKQLTIEITGLKQNVDHTMHITVAYSFIQAQFLCYGLSINTNGNNQGHIEITFKAPNETDEQKLLDVFTSKLKKYEKDAYTFII